MNTSHLFDLTGKVALVTGASSGLGVQFAMALARQGATLAILARRVDRLQMVKNDLERNKTKCIAIRCDITNERLVKEAVSTVIDKCGTIDILVNCAGTVESVPAAQIPMSQWDRTINTNLRSMYMMSKEVGTHMIAQKYGKVINISSLFGLVANTTYPLADYHASKHGVIGLTKALATEWAQYNITVNAIAPGYFESEMTEEDIPTEEFQQTIKTFCPMKRIGKPGELNGALIYLASDASSYTTGHTISVDGGWTAI